MLPPKSTDDEGYLKLLTTFQQCNQRIQQLEAKLQKEREYRDLLERKIAAIRSSIDIPILKLPQELLIRIFELVTHDNPMDIHHLLPVCRHWYNSATHYPYLWNRIEIRPKWDIHDADRLTKYVSCALRRSRNLPLDITIYVRGSYRLHDTVLEAMASAVSRDREGLDRLVSWFTDMEMLDGPALSAWQARYREILNKTAEHIHRWRSLCYDAESGEDETFCNFFSELKDSASILETVTIRGNSFDEDLIEDILPPAPKLKSLLIQAAYPVHFTLSDPLLLHELRTPFSHFGQISPLVNLRSLYLHLRGNWPFGGPTPRTLLPFLEQVSLHGQFPEHVLQAFDVPRLKILRLINETAAASIDPLKPINYRAFSRVTNLQLLNLPSLTGLEFFHVLRGMLIQFPYLERLTIPRWDERETFIALLELQRQSLCSRSLRYVDILIKHASGDGIGGSSDLFWKIADDFIYETRWV